MNDNKILFVTNDLILSLRAFHENISCIHTYNSKIQFIGLYQNNNLFFMNNPFELIIKGNYENHQDFSNLNKLEEKKELIQKILSNPIAILKLSHRKQINSKYLNYNFKETDNELKKLCQKYDALNPRKKYTFEDEYISDSDENKPDSETKRKMNEDLENKIIKLLHRYKIFKNEYKNEDDYYKLKHLLNLSYSRYITCWDSIIYDRINSIDNSNDLYCKIRDMFS